MPITIFFRTAIISMLTLGASWGIYLLIQLSQGEEFTKLNILEVDAHGIAQIYGWIGMVVVGASYHLFPRITQRKLPCPYLMYPVWIFLIVGTIISMLSLLVANLSSFMSLGGLLITGGVALFVYQMFTLLQGLRSFLFIKTAFVFLFLSSVYNLFHHVALLQATSQEHLLWLISTFQAPLRDMQVHGVGLFLVLGVIELVFEKGEENFKVWLLLLLGVVGEVLLFIIYRFTQSHLVAAFLLLPWLLLLIGSLLFFLQGERVKKLPVFAKLAGLWLLTSLTMLVLLPFYSFVSGIAFSHAYYGAIRHAITVGFLSQMIMGMIPRFLGKPLIGTSIVIINVGCLTRVLLQTLTDFSTLAFLLIPVSGLLELSALIIWSIPALLVDSTKAPKGS